MDLFLLLFLKLEIPHKNNWPSLTAVCEAESAMFENRPLVSCLLV